MRVQLSALSVLLVALAPAAACKKDEAPPPMPGEQPTATAPVATTAVPTTTAAPGIDPTLPTASVSALPGVVGGGGKLMPLPLPSAFGSMMPSGMAMPTAVPTVMPTNIPMPTAIPGFPGAGKK